MKIRIHDNGWTVMVEDFDLRTITQQQVNLLAKYLLTNTVVVIKNQTLSIGDEIRISNMFGTIQNLISDFGIRDSLVLPDSDGNIVRVTGELDEHGQPGMFGHVDELAWHCNRVSDPDRRPLVWLYGERGTNGSRTSWINNVLSYNDLSDEDKERFADLRLDVGQTQQFANYYKGDDYVPQDIADYRPKLVHTNEVGTIGLFFSFTQTHFIEGMDYEESRKFIEELRTHVEQEKYMYHHDWEDGDIVIAEQWLGIHKRWAFDHMDKRVLHRIAMDYSKVNFDDLSK